MNPKLSGILILFSFSMLIINHYLLDWEKIAHQQIEKTVDEIIADQEQDLVAWSKGGVSGVDFRKRKFCQGRIEQWSDDRPFIYNSKIDSIGSIENELGLFIIRVISDDDCEYVSIISINNVYSITNQYLKNGRSALLPRTVAGISKTSGNYQYRKLFYYDVSSSPNRIADAIVGLLLIIVLLVEFWKFSKLSKRNLFIGFIILSLLRSVSLWFDMTIYLFRYKLFDPINFSSSFLNPSLGDLLLNCILILLITILFVRTTPVGIYKKWVIVIITLIASCLSLLNFFITWSILDNSQILLDVGETINFDFLRSVSYVCILIINISCFIFLYHSLSIIREVKMFFVASIIAGIPSLVLLFLNPGIASIGLVHLAIVLISSKVRWGDSFTHFRYVNLLFMLALSSGMSVVFAFSIYKYHEQSELDSKRKFANYLLLKRDVLGEYYLDQTIERLSADEVLAEIGSTGSKEDAIDKIKTQFLNPYFNKYELDIVFQDYHQLKLNTRFTREYSLLTPENQSDYENIFFVDEGMSFKYICKINVGDLVGLIVLQIKKRVPTSVFPALLTDSKYFSPATDFDYAVFARGDILFHRSKFGQGEWPEGDDFQNEELFEEGIEKNNRRYYGVRTNDGRTILIISNKYNNRTSIANFSFFFLLLLFSFGLVVLLSSYSSKPAITQLNFTSKIQLYLGLAFVIPLFTAGFALLSSLNTSYREEINRSYLKQTLYISEILSDAMQDDQEINQKRLSEIGNFIQSDLSFYNSSGYLIATSQPEIFNLKLQSNLINPIVFEELIGKENQSMIADESIGYLDYKVSYAVVSSGIESDVVGFIAMPFFDSKNHLKRQQIEVFGNLISIFGLIFILAIVFGNAVLNNLLKPLRMVAGKIRKVTLQEVNEPIIYEASDEIGSLVKDYNHMLIKLEESKLALARSQKETAWKEIAKQVAHEIKNPLTPMQLKIQQMQRKHDPASKEYETLASLLTQVDTLSKIAESFSAFAEMPAPNNKVFDLARLAKQVAGLYQAENVVIDLNLEDECFIDADKDILRRILNNIVLNAIQSVAEKKAVIGVELEMKSNKCLLSVSDNGRGVPEELKDKIFLNYFSTKSTGSGIGLALAKKGIENAGGNIWFESKKEEGTTFFISLPLAIH